MLTALVASASFAVDIGMQRVARRDMQASPTRSRSTWRACSTAGTPARSRPGGRAAEPDRGDRRERSPQRRPHARRDPRRHRRPGPAGRVRRTGLRRRRAAARARGRRTGRGAGDRHTAVDFGFTGGKGGASRTALATADPYACFRLGSYALAVDAGDAADTGSARLDSMLEDALQVQGLGYHGLADSSVSLLGLAGGFGAATPDGLMSVEGVLLRDLFAVTADVLEREGGTAADVALLRTLAASAQTEAYATVDLADLVTVSSGGGAVLSSTISVLDLVAGSAFAADGTHALGVPVLWSVPAVLVRGDQPGGRRGAPAGLRGHGNHRLDGPARAHRRAGPPRGHGRRAGRRRRDRAARRTPGRRDRPPRRGGLRRRDRDGARVGDGRRHPRAVPRDLSVPLHLHGELKAADLGIDLGLFGISIVIGQPKVTLDLTIDAGVSTIGAPGTQTATYAVPPRRTPTPSRSTTRCRSRCHRSRSPCRT